MKGTKVRLLTEYMLLRLVVATFFSVLMKHAIITGH